MKTKALIPVTTFTEDKTYVTEDGLFMVAECPAPHYDLYINTCGWRFVTEVSSLRCARVWIKNFYRTLTFKREIVTLTELEAIAIKNLDTFMPKVGKFIFNTEHDCSALGLVHHEGTIHYLYQTVAEFYLSNTYNY